MKDREVVLIGQRIDFELDPGKFRSLNFGSAALLKEIDEMVQTSHPRVHASGGIDLFAFRTDELPFVPDVIPPFIMGRYRWDNWLVGYLNTICDTVSFNVDPPLYHVNHMRPKPGFWDKDVTVNDILKEVNGFYNGTNSNSVWKLSKGKVVKRDGSDSIDLMDA